MCIYNDPRLRTKVENVGGTVNSNRTEGAAAQLPNDKWMKRGDNACLVGRERICLVKWRDNMGVLTSSAVGCSRSPAEYKYMGGVDLLDRYVSYYRTK